MAGADPSDARPYSVREAMYRSELAAENTKRQMQPFTIPGSVLIPASLMATTNGEAAAVEEALVAKASSSEFWHLLVSYSFSGGWS